MFFFLIIYYNEKIFVGNITGKYWRDNDECVICYNNDDHLDIVLQDSWELWRTPLTVPAGFVMMVIHRNT